VELLIGADLLEQAAARADPADAAGSATRRKR
jgi:hypothetical protein